MISINHNRQSHDEQFDLSVYLSTTAKEPSVTQCQQLAHNKKVIKFFARGGYNIFPRDEVVYMNFSSVVGSHSRFFLSTSLSVMPLTAFMV